MCKFSREIIHARQNYSIVKLPQFCCSFSFFTTPSLLRRHFVLHGSFLLRIYAYIPKFMYFQILLKHSVRNVHLRGSLSKLRRAFIVYMFRRPPEVWSSVSDNALIPGTGKVGIVNSLDPHELLPGVSYPADPGIYKTTTTTKTCSHSSPVGMRIPQSADQHTAECMGSQVSRDYSIGRIVLVPPCPFGIQQCKFNTGLPVIQPRWPASLIETLFLTW